MIAVVERDVQTVFGAGEQQSAAYWVLLDCIGVAERRLGNAVDDQLPCFPKIGSAIQIWIADIDLMSIDGDVTGSRIVFRWDHGIDSHLRGHAFGSDIRPVRAAIAR